MITSSSHDADTMFEMVGVDCLAPTATLKSRPSKIHLARVDCKVAESTEEESTRHSGLCLNKFFQLIYTLSLLVIATNESLDPR